MSIFDDNLPSKHKFFHKLTISTEPFPKKKVLMECPIYFLQKNNSIQPLYIKIMDHKLYFFQSEKGDLKKYLDFKEMYRLSNYQDDRKKIHPNYIYYLALKKGRSEKVFFLNDGQNFAKLISVLKKYCILPFFNACYEIIEFLGSGHFAEVYSAKNKSNSQLFATKVFQKTSENFQKNQRFVTKEAKILRFLPDCPFVVKLFEIYENAEEVVLVLELMEGKDLFRTIKAFHRPTEHQIYKLFADIYKGVLFLNFHGIMHRDLKPDNILFFNESQNSKLKIADLSLAEELGHNREFDEFCGTPGFMAPEMLNNRKYNQKVDVFSLGVVLYMLFIGKPVFKGKNVKEILEKNKVGKISMRSKEWNNYSKEAKKLVRKMLYSDPSKRIDLNDICNEKWIKKHQKLKTEQTFQFNSKSHLEDHQTDINGTINNSKRGSIQQNSSFKNNFLRKSINKSKTEIVYSKKLAYLLTNTNDEAQEEEIQNEGDINHSKYSMEPKFLRTTNTKSSMQMLPPTPNYFENYSINSFLLCSKSEECSGSSLNNNTSEELKLKTQVSQMKKSSIDSSEYLDNNSRNSFEEFLKQDHGSLIFETRREEIMSMSIFNESKTNLIQTKRTGTDLELSEIVPGLEFTPFKWKIF